MGEVVISTNYARFKPVGQDDKCANCPCACKTSCARDIFRQSRVDNISDSSEANKQSGEAAKAK